MLKRKAVNMLEGSIVKGLLAMQRGFCIALCLGALSAIFSRELSGFMSGDPLVIAHAWEKMVIISSTYFLCGTDRIIGQSLRAMGKPMAATVSTMVWMCAFRFFWVYVVYPFLPQGNLTSLYLVWPIGWLLSICTLLCVFFPTVRKLGKKVAEQGAAI